MSEGLLRIAVGVPATRAEEARARALELAPGGFEESESPGRLMLVFYVTRESAETIDATFPGAEITPVEPGWRTAGAPSTDLPARAASGSGPRGSTPTRASRPS